LANGVRYRRQQDGFGLISAAWTIRTLRRMKTFPTTVLLRRLTAVGGEKAADATSGVAQWNQQPRERGAWFVIIRLIADQERRAARVMDVLIGVQAIIPFANPRLDMGSARA
jgi:hypothetical protein